RRRSRAVICTTHAGRRWVTDLRRAAVLDDGRDRFAAGRRHTGEARCDHGTGRYERPAPADVAPSLVPSGRLRARPFYRRAIRVPCFVALTYLSNRTRSRPSSVDRSTVVAK